jgi:predicted transcriptional regulator
VSLITVATTIKLPKTLKSRVANAAAVAGKAPHAFMVEAIERQTAVCERRDFLADALAAREEIGQRGLVYDGDEVVSYLKARLEGCKLARPRKRRL